MNKKYLFWIMIAVVIIVGSTILIILPDIFEQDCNSIVDESWIKACEEFNDRIGLFVMGISFLFIIVLTVLAKCYADYTIKLDKGDTYHV